jgi:hypothetical protein
VKLPSDLDSASKIFLARGALLFLNRSFKRQNNKKTGRL